MDNIIQPLLSSAIIAITTALYATITVIGIVT